MTPRRRRLTIGAVGFVGLLAATLAPSPWIHGAAVLGLLALGISVIVWYRAETRSLRERIGRQQQQAESDRLLGETAKQHESALETERQLRQALETAAAQWRATIDSLPVALCLLDDDGRVMRLNRPASNLSDREPSSCIGLRVGDVSGREPWHTMSRAYALRVERLVVRVPETGQIWSIRLRRLADDVLSAWMLRAVDVTHEVRLQSELDRSRRSAELGRLLAAIAHEVRNPLFAIMATLETWEDDDGAPQYADYGPNIRAAAERLRSVMADLLEYGRPVGLSLAPAKLGSIIRASQSALARFARQHDVRLEMDCMEHLPVVRVDESRLVQLFVNLLDNALHHTPPGGTIRVCSEVTDWGVAIHVDDTGPGFAPHDLPYLGQPFVTKRKGGTGLGLAIVKRIAADHNGEVSLRNRPEGGARVTVRLPVTHTHAELHS